LDLRFELIVGVAGWGTIRLRRAYGWGVEAEVCLLLSLLPKPRDPKKVTKKGNHGNQPLPVCSSDFLFEDLDKVETLENEIPEINKVLR
jgi:hypothetical protein